MNSHYYIPPETGFKDLIHAIWQVDGFPAYEKERILPKGIVEVIFNFSDTQPIPSQLGNRNYNLSHCFINGFNKAPIHTHLPERQEFFGVIFHPLAIKKILRIPAGEFANVPVDLTLIDAAFHSLWHQLAEQLSFLDKVRHFLSWLSPHRIDWPPQEQLLNHFLSAQQPQELTIPELARSLCYSPRHLARKVLEATGMNTEELLLYKKYLHAVDLMHQDSLSLTEIAYHSHFYDQSHLIKTFKAYTGITPGAYQKNRSGVKGHVYENVR